MKKILVLLLAVSALLMAPAARAGNAADEFSATDNPSGAWSYGWTTALGAPFQLFVNRSSSGSADFWYGNQPPLGASPGYPAIWRSSVLPEGVLIAHPGPAAEYAVLRWTAPIAGATPIDVEFTRQDVHPTTSDVHVLLNGISLFDSTIDAASASQTFMQTISLAAGDTLDFAVGYGANGDYFFDSTGINATVGAVPEPATAALLIAGVLSVLQAARRRRGTTAA